MSVVPRGTLTREETPVRAATAGSQEMERPRSRAARLMLVTAAILAFLCFAALGTWQVKRLYWKLALIERVEQRVRAPATDVPAQSQWPQIDAETDEYRHVRLNGSYLYELTVRVQASTELGSGWWLLTPLRMADGSTVLVNRGFIPSKAGDWTKPGPEISSSYKAGSPASVTGLLRMTEPGGAFLRKNDPAAGRWYSRDVSAIAAALHLPATAPYFVDADAAAQAAAEDIGAAGQDRPTGGLTVVSFHNSHLVYAITWYVLALMVAGALFWSLREERSLAGKRK